MESGQRSKGPTQYLEIKLPSSLDINMEDNPQHNPDYSYRDKKYSGVIEDKIMSNQHVKLEKSDVKEYFNLPQQNIDFLNKHYVRSSVVSQHSYSFKNKKNSHSIDIQQYSRSDLKEDDQITFHMNNNYEKTSPPRNMFGSFKN